MARVRTPLGALRKVLVESPHPIWLLDRQRTVAFVNPAVEQWCGATSDQLLGARGDYHWDSVEPGTRGIAASLAPPPEIYDTPQVIHTCSTAVASQGVPPRAGESMDEHQPVGERGVLFFPLLNSSGKVQGILGIAATEDGAITPPLPLDPGRERETRELHLQLGHLRRKLQGLYDLPQLIGKSAALVRVRAQVELAAQSRGRVLIKGLAGSGREHVARTIHYLAGTQRERFLVPLSCGLLDAELLESAITDFVRGPAEIALESPLTILLLDADQLTADAQICLMRILQESDHDIHTLTTSQRCLIAMSTEGVFREDLAHHLSTLVIELPTLSERSKDIPLLAQYLLERHNAAGRKQLSGFSPEAMDRLASYEWPGNLDQLVDVVRDSWERAAGSRVEETDLPELFHHADESIAHPRPAEDNIVLDEFLQRVEAELLRRAMRRSRGNRARAARLLGISRARLLRRLAQLGIELE